MYKRTFFVLLFIGIFSFLLPIFSSANPSSAQPDVSARAAALVVLQTGETLYSKNENEKLPMASTTKIMTSVLALESGKQQQTVKVKPYMLQVEGSSMGLLPEDTVSLEALVDGMLLKSGNDAAQVTAYMVAGDIPSFLRQMNQKAKDLQMTNSHFASVSGLDVKTHYSTASDMAKLACYALQNPKFRSICSQKSLMVSYGNPPYSRTLVNHNRLLRSYDGAIGVKTGFTKKSGRCLVSAAERSGITLVCVTLNDPKDWEDHQKLLDFGFSKVQWKNAAVAQQDLVLPVVGGTQDSVKLLPEQALRLPLANADASLRVEIYKAPFLYAPLSKNTVAGKAVLYANERKCLEIPLFVAEDVNVQHSKSKNR